MVKLYGNSMLYIFIVLIIIIIFSIPYGAEKTSDKISNIDENKFKGLENYFDDIIGVIHIKMEVLEKL